MILLSWDGGGLNGVYVQEIMLLVSILCISIRCACFEMLQLT